MIEILKKRYKLGDTITLHTPGASFTGIIDAFEENCVILVTIDGHEFISNETINRISVPKTKTDNIQEELLKKPERANEPITEKTDTPATEPIDTITEKTESPTT